MTFAIKKGFLASLLAFCSPSRTIGDNCRSNATHIAWKLSDRERETILTTLPAFGRHLAQQVVTSRGPSCVYQTRQQAEQECVQFLSDNLMAFDVPFQQTMGFPNSSPYGDDDDADGLDNGLIGPTVTLSLDAKVLYPWTDALPKYIFQNYVMNYANFNEARTNWRPLLVDTLNFTETDLYQNRDATNVSSVVTWVNTVLWTKLGRPGKSIYFKPSQTPLIFDTMSTIAFGYASCTGTSILFTNALRSIGIAARVVGTPAWHGNVSQGNHNWVEVYDIHENPNVWKFLEPSPSLPHVDTIDDPPCSRWFCKANNYPASKVYAARLEKYSVQEGMLTHVPLPWEWYCQDVPGIDRTNYYAEVCGACHLED